MIVDQLNNANQYAPVGTPLRRALDHILNEDLLALELGRIEIDGDTIFLMRQQYTTRPHAGAIYEAHRRYLDVHVVLAGREAMYWAPTAGLATVEEYSEENDALMLRDHTDDDSDLAAPRVHAQLAPGTFAIVFPQDAHIPACQWGEAAPVEKLVVKVLWSAGA